MNIFNYGTLVSIDPDYQEEKEWLEENYLNFYERMNDKDILLVSPEKAKEIINAWIDFFYRRIDK